MLKRDDHGNWDYDAAPPPSWNPEYARRLPRYLSAFDKLFLAARRRSEFDFVLALVHHNFDSHSDPFETTKRTIERISLLHAAVEDFETEVTLLLWLYGHIVEASYPYQVVGDLVGIADGNPHGRIVFPKTEDGGELSPGRKITELEEAAAKIGLKSCIKPLRETWNALLRNAVSHSNYAIFGDKIRLTVPGRTFQVSKIVGRANRALAAFEALVTIEARHRATYTAPAQILAPEYFAHEAGTMATVVIREGYGPVAIHSTVADFGVESSPVIIGRMTVEELELVMKGTFLLPKRGLQET
jgi:hypothetical protein